MNNSTALIPVGSAVINGAPANVVNARQSWQRGVAKLVELRANGQLLTPIEKFIGDPRPLRAIRRFCYECNGYSYQYATDCTNRDCPLWLFRRGSSVIKSEELAPWQKAYSHHMEVAGELNSTAADIEPEAVEEVEKVELEA